jgi:hypothetical protein
MPRIVPSAAFGAVVCVALGVSSGGCVTRPVAATEPITRTNFISSIPQSSIDKVDLLFDIDNSASMGDKQAYLSQAIPDLVSRLVTPNCVDDKKNPTGAQAQLDGTCPAGSSAEFPPVHNLHIGILSSSLGSRLGDQCISDPSKTASKVALKGGGTLDRHNDDQAHLLDRSADPMDLADYTETPLGAADPDHFLDWFPPASVDALNANVMPTGPAPVTDPATLQLDFQKLVVGVHQFGCGIESQLETWYRFLIQPDPYASLALDTKSQKYAEWVGVDTTILAQRADFLRPDSLVAILVLTDENDSEVDVRSFGGTGWMFMSTAFTPPRGTSACQSPDPTMVASSACTSCGFDKTPNDPQCMTPPTSDCALGSKAGVYCSPTDWGFNLNLRHVHEVQKYGASVQFPIQRYVIGLTSSTVPNRDGEYPPDSTQPSGYAPNYGGLEPSNQKCTNPLFAAALPTPPAGTDPASWTPDPVKDLCDLPLGTRTPSLVYYAHIGGVPHQLLQVNPMDADSPQKSSLTPADWTLILGNDPEHFDYTGIDPHMVESFQPRTNVAVPPNGFKVAAANEPAGTDPIAGREWITNSSSPVHPGGYVDREYACVFKLTDQKGSPTPRHCDPASIDPTMGGDPTLADSCDCEQPTDGSYSQSQLPAVCNDGTPTEQDYAKAYPTIRELEVAKLLGVQGVISSLCPIHTTDESTATQRDELYGYRPAMNAIVDKLAANLGTQCLPQKLTFTTDPTTGGPAVSCLVMGTFPSGASDTPASCDSIPGYKDPEPDVLAHFEADQHAKWLAAGNSSTPDPSKELTCELKQLPPETHCDKQTTDTGWCYVDDGSVSNCPQAILFSPDALEHGVQTSLQCLEAASGFGAPSSDAGALADAGASMP